MMRPDEPCELCAIKHIGRAHGMYKEVRVGHTDAFWACLAEISLAEDHLVEKHEALALRIREHRKSLELIPRYKFPWAALEDEIALLGGYDLSVLLDDNGFKEVAK